MLRVAIAAFFIMSLLPGFTRAEEFPSRPIRIVVPFPAGSTIDAMTRFLGKKVSEDLKQTVIVENRPGALGAIAAAEVARAAPDGYTLLAGSNSTQAANVYLLEKLPYDPARNFAGITQFSNNPLVMVVNAESTARTLEEFLSQARAKPNGMNFGVGNTGSLVSGAKLMASANFSAVPVNYAGTPQAIVDLLAGRLDFMITDVSVTRPYIKSGQLRALAVTTKERVPALPQIPTMSEAGVKGYEFAAWCGLFAPINTPKARIDLLSAAFSAAVKSPEGHVFWDNQGLIGVSTAPAELDAHVIREIDSWGKMLAQAGVKKQ